MEDKEELWSAFQRLEKIRHKFCCLEILSDYEYVWGIRYIYSNSPEHKTKSADLFNYDTLAECINDFCTLVETEKLSEHTEQMNWGDEAIR